jgi:hypothetical protein
VWAFALAAVVLSAGGSTSCQIDDRQLHVGEGPDAGGGEASVGDATTMTTPDEAGGGEASVDEASTPPDAGMNVGGVADGTPCTAASQCLSNVCADGLCCHTACGDACSACNVGGSEGTCSPLPDGQSPLAGHGDCGPDAQATCLRDGTCNGHGQCRYWGTQTICKSSACNITPNTVVGTSTCDGIGNCVAPASVTCAPFACKPDATACEPTCTGSAECSAGNVCTGSSCGLKVASSPCTTNGECLSNACVDGVCCGGACPGQCQACDVTGHVGVCTTLTSGPPHGTRAKCTSDGTVCGGSCQGTATACTYASATTPCRNQTCTAVASPPSASLSLAADCNAAGTCSASTKQACSAPAHGSASCLSNACSFGCDNYHAVSGSACVAKWTAESASTGAMLGVWGSSPTDVYAIDFTHVYHSTGNGTWSTSFTVPSSGVGSFMNFFAIWGDASHPQSVYVVGPDGTILVTTTGGSAWSQVADPNDGTENYNAVSGNGSSASKAFVYAVGDFEAMQNQVGWVALTQNTRPASPLISAYALNVPSYFFAGDRLGNILASDSNGQLGVTKSTGWSAVNGMWGPLGGSAGIYAVGSGGGIIVGTGCSSSGGPITCTWATQASGTTQALTAVYGYEDPSTDTYTFFVAVGNAGTILTSTGNGTWTAQVSHTTANVTAVWAANPNDIFATADDGTVMHLNGP